MTPPWDGGMTPSWDGGMKVSLNGLCHMTKMSGRILSSLFKLPILQQCQI